MAKSPEERDEFLLQANKSMERLQQDAEAWAEYQAEVELWEVTLMDGLEDEPPYPAEPS